MNKIHLIILAAAAMLPLSVRAQYAWQDGAEAGKLDLGKDDRYQVEMQGSFSHGKTPLWLNAIAMFAMRPPTNEHTCLPSSCRMSRQACPTAMTLLTVVPPFPHHGSSCRDTRHDGAAHTAPL